MSDNSRFNAGTDPAANTGTDDSHCCQQYADLTGLSVEVVKRVGSCGCVQAKRELAELRAERRADRAHVMRLRAELERVRPVVEAACEWRTVYVSDADDEWNPKMAGLQRAVDAYRNDHTDSEEQE